MRGPESFSVLWSPAGTDSSARCHWLDLAGCLHLETGRPIFLALARAGAYALYDLITGREIRDNLLVTLARAAIGLALGCLAGCGSA